MVVFPNCKINIGLNILAKRPDGFHDLETVFIPVPLHDSLEIIRSPLDQTIDVLFSQSGFVVDGPPEDNLCIKAYRLVKKDFPSLPPVQMHLHKALPMGAGLGGGSADAAFTLRLLNDKFQLGLSVTQLLQYSLSLGSDCPFFILNEPCFATGRGEILSPVTVSLKGYYLLLINPGIHINTGWAFTQLHHEPAGNRISKSLQQRINMPVTGWRSNISNDFEAPVFAAHPLLKEIKDNLYNNGAVYAAMSGSGSTVFGLFQQPVNPTHFKSEWMVKLIQW